MAKLTLTDLASLENAASAVTSINNNNAAIETALENTLSRDGTSPNSMSATLDMNSNRIINLPEPSSDSEPLRLIDYQPGADADSAAASAAVAAASETAAASSATSAASSASSASTSATSAASSATDAENAAVAAGGMFTQSGTGAVVQSLGDVLTDTIFTPEMFGATGDTVYMRGNVTTTAGSTTVTVSGANFTSADVGKIIAIGGCGYYVAHKLTLGAGGSGYGSLPTLTVVGGTAVTATTMYAIGSAGAIVRPNQTRVLGLYTAVPSNPVATTSDDAGTGATINITWRNLAHRATIASVTNSTTIVLNTAPFVSLTASKQEVIYGSDDTTEVQEAVNAWVTVLRSGRSATLKLPHGYTTTSTVSAALLEDDAPGTIDGGGFIHFASTTNSTKCLLIYGPGDQAGKIAQIAADANRGNDTFTVTSTVNIAEGDIFWMTARNNIGADMAMSNRIVSISGTTVTLAYSLEFNVVGAYPTSVQVWKPARNVTIKDLTLYGNGTTGQAVVGLQAISHEFLTISNVKAYNFNTDSSEGVGVYECLEGDIEARCYRCGGGSATYAAHAAYTTASHIKLSSVESYGFGLQILLSSGNKVDLRNRRSSYRGVKFYSSCGNVGTVDHVRANVAVPAESWTGLSLDGASSYNILDVRSLNTSHGIWSAGLGETGNTIRSYRYAGNTTDLVIGSGTSNFQINCSENTAATVLNSGTNTTITGSAWTNYTFTPTAGSGTLTSATGTGYYQKIGKTVVGHARATITTNGTGASSINITLPFAPSAHAGVIVYGRTTSVTGKMLVGFADSGTTVGVTWYDNTYPGASGEILEVSFSYEVD